jgi:hypothetical protein
MILYQINATRLQGMAISLLLDWAQLNGGGPGPVLPLCGPTHRLSERDPPFVIALGSTENTLVASGIHTCAGVVLVSQDRNATPLAVVYHAPAGLLRDGIVEQMHGMLGGEANRVPPIASLLAFYAAGHPWDAKYNAQAMKIENYGVPANQLVCIDRLPGWAFGVNSFFQIGWGV